MALEPEIAQLLAQLRDMPALDQLAPADARAIVGAMERVAPAGPELRRIEVQSVPTPAGNVPVRIYHAVERPRGLIVFFAGGGWVLGNLDTSDAFLRRFALQTQCCIVTVEYRHAPEHRFPAAVIDASHAVAWAARSCEALTGVRLPLIVAGESAGGNLAAVTAILARDAGTPNIAGQLLLYPVTDAAFDTPSYRDNAEGYFLTRDTMRWFWSHYVPALEQRSDFRAAPLRASNLGGLPPALVQTAEFDPLRDEGEAYAQRMMQEGTPVTVQRRAGIIHSYTGMTEFSPGARAAIEDAARWVTRICSES
jgi:acetyl esterase